MNLKHLNEKLVNRGVLATCEKLLPGGRASSTFYCCRDINGGEGTKLKVNLSTGVWQDFTTSNLKGDLLSLWQFKYGDKAVAHQEACTFLGISSAISINKEGLKKKKKWKEPDPESLAELSNSCREYLFEGRGVNESVINKLVESGELGSSADGKAYCFISFDTETKKRCGANFCKVKRKNGKKETWQSTAPLSSLWGWKSIDKTKNYILITEGQIDAMSFRSCEVSNAVSIPFGSNNLDWIEYNYEFLQKFKYVVLCGDNDEAGNEFVEKAGARIGMDRIKICKVPEKWKDANESLIAGYDLNLCFKDSKEPKPDKLIEASELTQGVLSRIFKGKREDQGIPFCGFEGPGTINFRVRPREFTIFSGYPGSGKSNILYQHVSYLIFHLNEKVVIASLEEDAEEIIMLILTHSIARMLTRDDAALIERMMEKIKDHLYFYYHRNRANHIDVLTTAEYTIRKYGVRHFVFDSVAKTDLNVEDNEKVNEFVSRVCTSMNETAAHYYLVAHSRKGDDTSFDTMPGLNEIKGAAAFGIECFNAIILWRNKPKQNILSLAEQRRETKEVRVKGKVYSLEEIKRDWADTLICIVKQKVGGQTGQYKAWFDRASYRLRTEYDEDIKPYYVEEKEKEEASNEVP